MAQIIRWLEKDHKPSQAELALASPVIKYLWLLQLVLLSGGVYFQRVEQQTCCYDNLGEGGSDSSRTFTDNHTGTLS